MTQISLILFQFRFDFPISNLTSNPAPENCNQVQGGPQFHVSWSWETQWNAWIQKHFRHIGLLSDRLIYPSWQACEKKVFVQIVYSYGHLSVITGYKWDYTFYKWGYKYLQLVKGHNCITLYKMIFPGPEKNDETPVARSRDGEALYVTKCQNWSFPDPSIGICVCNKKQMTFLCYISCLS